jgi:hypothetical protein
MRCASRVPRLAVLVLAASPVLLAADAPKLRAVLVEADGRDEELSAFVARFESELSDGGAVAFADARLAGTTLGSLQSEPDGERTRAFRTEWPGETWFALSLAPCNVKVSRMQYSDTTPEGYRVQRVVENVTVVCEATFRLVDAATGKERKPFTVAGTAGFRRNEGEDGETSELEGARAAAKKAAKKLASEMKR